MKPDKELTTKIEIESRIATRISHIHNALDLHDLGEELDKEYIRKELSAISSLVSKGIFNTEK